MYIAEHQNTYIQEINHGGTFGNHSVKANNYENNNKKLNNYVRISMEMETMLIRNKD